MPKKTVNPELPELYAVLREGKKAKFILAAWKYHEIVLELQFAGISRTESYDTARRISRLRDEELIRNGNISISVERRLI